eukprot:gene2128-biopygen3930
MVMVRVAELGDDAVEPPAELGHQRPAQVEGALPGGDEAGVEVPARRRDVAVQALRDKSLGAPSKLRL